jgi:hypothetical protein
VKVESDVEVGDGRRDPLGYYRARSPARAYHAALSRQTDGLPPTTLVNAGEEVDHLHRLFAGI